MFSFDPKLFPSYLFLFNQVTDTKSQTDILVTRFQNLENQEMVKISIENALIGGESYKVSMDFTAILNNELRGFYRSTYVENGVTK